MKKSAISCLLMFVLVLSFGCKKDETAPATPGLSVKIDGTTWTGQANSAFYNAQQNITLISSSNTALTELLQLEFAGNSTGTYNFTANDIISFGTFTYMANFDMYTTLFANIPVGQIVVTEYDKTNHTISGTFHFEAYSIDDQKKVLSEGKFTKLIIEEQ